jgi:glycosyltransferase involved in cell wall biosynthesis
LAAIGSKVRGIGVNLAPLSILYLLTQDLESPGGLGRYFPLARALAARGHHVRIAALHSNWDTLTDLRFEQDGVLVEYVAPMHVQKSGNQKRYYSSSKLLWVTMQASWALSRAALTAPVEIIHVGKPHPMNSLAGLLAHQLKNRILCVDCDDYEAGSNRFGQKWQKTVVAFFEKLIPRCSDLVTTNTQYMQAKILSWGCPPERIFYLSTGIDRQRFAPIGNEEVATLRKTLGIDQIK